MRHCGKNKFSSLEELKNTTAEELFKVNKVVVYEKDDVNKINRHINSIRKIMNKYTDKLNKAA